MLVLINLMAGGETWISWEDTIWKLHEKFKKKMNHFGIDLVTEIFCAHFWSVLVQYWNILIQNVLIFVIEQNSKKGLVFHQEAPINILQRLSA